MASPKNFESDETASGFADRDLAAAFKAMETVTVGLDAVTEAVAEAGSAVEAAARTANMNRRALLAARYETLRADIGTLERACHRSMLDILGRGETSPDVARVLGLDSDDPAMLSLVHGVEGFKDAAMIEAARDALAAARNQLDFAAASYRELAAQTADRIAALGPEITASKAEPAGQDTGPKKASLGDRLRGLFGSRAA